MNYLLTEEMTEYRDETEQMLIPSAACWLMHSKKFIMIQSMSVHAAMFVPAEDFVVSYGCSADLATCPRYTHVMKKTPTMK